MDWSLFVSALLSATLLPGSSEVLLIYKLGQGDDPLLLLLSATSGNLLGSLVTYLMGRGGNALIHKRWLGIIELSLARAERWFQRFGIYSLLLAWLPVIGDPHCLLAGLMKVRVMPFILLVGFGKALRYASIIYLVI